MGNQSQELVAALIFGEQSLALVQYQSSNTIGHDPISINKSKTEKLGLVNYGFVCH